MQPIQADHELLVSEDGQVLLDVSFYRVDRLPNTLIHDDGVSPSVPTVLFQMT